MACQVPQQIHKAVVDSDTGKHTGQANSGPSAPPSALLLVLPVKVMTAKKAAEMSADNNKKKTSANLGVQHQDWGVHPQALAFEEKHNKKAASSG